MDLRDTIAGQRCGRSWLWSEEEIALLLAGLPTPSRSEIARKKKRYSLGIRLRQPRRTLTPYQPPPPRPSGHIPWPKWWNRAHTLRCAGYGPTNIATILGKSRFTVLTALYPDIRQRCAEHTKRRKLKLFQDPTRRALDNKRAGRQDKKRLQIRQFAREEWRAAGGAPGALENFYRKYECL